MIIPTFVNVKYTEEDGFLTPPMQLYNDELNQSMQNGLSDNGWTVPRLTTANIALIEPQMPEGTIWFNTNIKKLVVKTGSGIIEVIQSL